MPKIIQIEIKSPVWHNRSVGISLAQANPDDTIEITISYQRKDGTKPFPYTYILLAKEIYKYGVKYIRRNMPLYEVPICDFRIKEELSVNVNTNF